MKRSKEGQGEYLARSPSHCRRQRSAFKLALKLLNRDSLDQPQERRGKLVASSRVWPALVSQILIDENLSHSQHIFSRAPPEWLTQVGTGERSSRAAHSWSVRQTAPTPRRTVPLPGRDRSDGNEHCSSASCSLLLLLLFLGERGLLARPLPPSSPCLVLVNRKSGQLTSPVTRAPIETSSQALRRVQGLVSHESQRS